MELLAPLPGHEARPSTAELEKDAQSFMDMMQFQQAQKVGG